MAVFSKAKFSWREPRGAVVERARLERSARRRWSGIVGVAATTGVMMLLWAGSRFIPARTPPGFDVALMLSSGLGIFLFYLLPPLVRLCPSEVRLTERGITVHQGSAQLVVAWSELDSFAIIRDGDVRLLRLHSERRGDIDLALEAKVPRGELEGFLARRGLAALPLEEEQQP